MSGGHGEKLSRKQERAIVALLTQPTIKAAAETVSISERTLRTWLKLTGFRCAFRAARAELLEDATCKLAQGATEAAETLRALLNSASPTVQLGAARAILELGPKLQQAAEMEQRLSEVEALLKEAKARELENPNRAAG
jgi:hypothetical protein